MLKRRCLIFFILATFTLLGTTINVVIALEWTKNSEFNNNGEYWVARTWMWAIFWNECQSPSGGTNDFAKFILDNNDWVTYLQADLDDPWWVVCAGVTQGWVWGDENKPDGIYQLSPLSITTDLSSLKLYTYVSYAEYYTGSWEYGILSDVWFKAFDVVRNWGDGQYEYYPESVFGIDFYYRIGGSVYYPSDQSFNDRLPDCFIYIKYNLGIGPRTCDILSTIIEASQKGTETSPQYLFSPWKLILYQVENVVEENMGFCAAKFKYLKVVYEYSSQSSSSTSDPPKLYILGNDGWIYDGPILINYNKDIVDVHVIKGNLKEYNGTYKIRLVTSNKATYIDRIILLGINQTTNKGFEIPIAKAIIIGSGEVTEILKQKDKSYLKLKPGESIIISFKIEKMHVEQYKYILVVIGKQI